MTWRRRHSRRAFTLVETSVCVVIVGVMLAAVLQTVGASSVAQYKLTERARGQQLGRALLAEILEQSYADSTAPVFGTEAGESSRASFDDVDDYNGLSESPPLSKDGTSLGIPRGSTWKCTVAVTWVNALTMAVATPQAETGAKRIVVTVFHNNVPVATLTGVKTNVP